MAEMQDEIQREMDKISQAEKEAIQQAVPIVSNLIERVRNVEPEMSKHLSNSLNNVTETFNRDLSDYEGYLDRINNLIASGNEDNRLIPYLRRQIETIETRIREDLPARLKALATTCESIMRYHDIVNEAEINPTPENETKAEEAKNDIDRDTIIARIHAFAGSEIGTLAANKRVNEKTLIHIAEQYPESEELIKSFRTLEAASRGLDVSEAEMAEAHAALSKTLNSETYEKAFKGISSLKDKDVDEILNTLRCDILEKSLADSVVADDAVSVKKYTQDLAELRSEGTKLNIIKDESPAYFLKQAISSIGNGFKSAGDNFYKAGCQAVQNAKDAISHIHEAVKDKAQDVRDFGIGLMKSVAGFTSLTLNKLKTGINNCKDKIVGLTEKVKGFIHNRGVDIKQGFLKFANTIHKANIEYSLKHDLEYTEAMLDLHHKSGNFWNELANKTEVATRICAVGRQNINRGPNLIESFLAIPKTYTGDEMMPDNEVVAITEKLKEKKAEIKTPILGKVLSAPMRAFASVSRAFEQTVEKVKEYREAKIQKVQDKIEKNNEKIDELEDERV